MDQLSFEKENHKRIQEVQNAFGSLGAPLDSPDRILVGEGCLMKQGRKGWEPKMFFLFNDILVYGSILLKGRWYKNQKIIPLETIKLEDMEDSEYFKHQWLICTPRKSFFVSAMSYEEKQGWMKHIDSCQRKLLQAGSYQPSSSFAVSWIPDQAAQKCMRCFVKFSNTSRRHHCRKCGFVVCHQCSKLKGVIDHIHPTKQLRICKRCHQLTSEEEIVRQRGDSTGKNSVEDEDEFSDDMEV
ncbi:pleckstrin homology domain-containing family F member 1-like [Melanotaenia boesemani]|uniref:pleckstrin homology domain-containing family F member 1-like n=1 Tax=Melanotaenia boesemani TaxID=1250792 RepID=UPI001C04A5FE|nr:pleckstrin homology domain-containing family F member 1-like [Melanotaenia boesemani]